MGVVKNARKKNSGLVAGFSEFYKNKKVLQMNDFVSFKKTSFSEVSFNGKSSFSSALGN